MTEVFGEIRNGRLLHESQEEFDRLIAAVKATGKKGKFILSLTVSVAGRDAMGTVDQLSIDDEISLKIPRPTKSQTLFFAAADSRLSRTDPRQAALFEGEKPIRVEE